MEMTTKTMFPTKFLERLRQRLFGMTADELKELEEIEQITVQVVEELHNQNYPMHAH
jgi:hypothetical protein